MNFKLKTPNSKNESLILFYANLKNGERFVYSTGEKIHQQYWDNRNQYPKKSKAKDEQITYNLISGSGMLISSMQFHDLLQTPSMLFFGFLWFAKTSDW